MRGFDGLVAVREKSNMTETGTPWVKGEGVTRGIGVGLGVYLTEKLRLWST